MSGPSATSTAPPRPSRDRSRLVGVVVLTVVLGVALAVGSARTPPAVPVLGTPAAASGLSSTGPPPGGLRVAWSLPVADGGPGVIPRRSVSLVAGGGRLAVDRLVLDVERGTLVGTVPQDAVIGADGTGVVVAGDELVRIDVLDGRVLGRTPLPDDVGARPVVVARAGGVTVVEHGTDVVDVATVLVRDDGEVVARVAGRLEPGLDRAVGGPQAVVVRGAADVVAPTTVVAVADGRLLAELPGGSRQVTDVVGDRVLVTTATSADVGTPGVPARWMLRLLDTADGRTLARVDLASEVAPRLAGRLDDGSVVVATRLGRRVGVWRVGPGPTSDAALLRLATTVLHSSTPGSQPTFDTGENAMLGAVAVDGDLVLLHDGAVERVVAIGPDGTQQWARPTDGPVTVAAAGGLVAVLPSEPDRPVRVLQTEDGADLAGVLEPGTGPSSPVPVAVLDHDLALAPPSSPVRLDAPIPAITWVDVVSGQRRTAEEVLVDRLRVDEPVADTWRLVGVSPDDDAGGDVPVVLRDLGRDVVQLLEPGSGFRSLDVDLPDEGEVARYRASVVGATPTHLALWTDSFSGPAAGVTHVVERSTGAAVRIPGVAGIVLRDDLLLGVVFDQRGMPTDLGVVGHDPVTGDRRWRRPAPPPGTPLVDVLDDDLLLRVSSVGVEAVALADGSTAWQHDAPVALGGGVVLGPSHAAVVTVTGEVVALERASGTEVWRTGIGVPVTAITGAGDHVLVGTVDGLVVHLGRDGREIRRWVVGSGRVSAVAALGDTVVAVVDGTLVGLRTDAEPTVPADEVELP